MCGLGGFVNVTDPAKRRALVIALGFGIDTRGGDACGYVTTGQAVRYGRRIGTWETAGKRFIAAASSGPNAMLHARFATHTNATEIRAAHPFAIKRPDARGLSRTVLWGAHNGVCSDAWMSARDNKRELTVDSLEVLELVADGKYNEVRELDGWGVLTWVRSDTPNAIRLVQMSDCGALEIVRTTCGAVVYASTRTILDYALEVAAMQAEYAYTVKTGEVYEALTMPDGMAELRHTTDPELRFASYYAQKPRYRTSYAIGPDGRIDEWESEPLIAVGALASDTDDEWDSDADDPYKALEEEDFDRAAFLRWLERNENPTPHRGLFGKVSK